MTSSPAGYTDLHLLGRGAFGEVYAASDAQGRAAALKVMAPEAAARPEAVWQFLAEHRRLARLAHPAFPAALDAGTTPDGRPYYAMALADGSNPTGPQAPEEVRRVLGALAEALAYLHGQGLVHGDLKAENLRVAPDGHVWVLDVGLMAPVGQKREAVAGTPTHMAPEVLRRAPVAPAADLYALGVVGYELWTGRPAFDGGPGELARAHLQAPPPALPAGDPALSALLQGLLAKDAAARPASALAVLAALGHAVDPALGQGPLPGLLGGDYVGRAEVLAGWESAGWLAIAGAPGEGKSRSLDELRLAAQVAGRTWVGAACAGGAPGAPVRAAVGQALAAAGLVPDGAAKAWLDGVLTPELADMEPAARKVTLFAAAAAALADAAGRLGGLVVGLDDWQRADQASRDFLDFLRRADGAAAPITWAVALDPAQAPTERALPPELTARELGPFTDAEAREHVAARLGAAPPDALLETLAGAARGNPLLLDLALEHLVARGALRRMGDGWRYDAAIAAQAGLPAGLADAWRARAERLPAAARRLAAAAALAVPAGALPVPLLARAAGLDGDALAGALEAATAEGVVGVEGGTLRFLAAGAEALFLADLAPADRVAWAELWALALLAPEPGSAWPEAGLETADFDALARAANLVLAVDAPTAGKLAAEAGRRAMAMSAPGDALRLLSAAEARLVPDAPEAERLAVALPKAEAARFVDKLPEAAEAYEGAIALAARVGLPKAEAAALVGLAKVRQMQGNGAAAIELYEAADARAALANDPAQRSRAQSSLARVKLFAGEPAAGAELAQSSARLAQEAGNRSLRSQALTLLGYIRVTTDPQDAATGFAQLDEALALARAVGDRVSEGMALDNMGNVRLALGDLPAAAAAFRAFAALARANGTATEALFADLNLALALGELGAVAEAAPLAADVARRAAAAGRKYVLGAAKSVAAQAAWRTGDLGAAMRDLDEALALAQAINHLMLEEHVRLYRLEALLARGAHEAARGEAEALAAIVAKTAHAEAAARLATLEAELALQAGDRARAAALAGPLASAFNRVAAHQALGILARATPDADAALDHAETARGIAAAWQAPWHVAADLLLMARAVEPADAGTACAWAAEALELAGANPYAAAGAALLLRRQGVDVAVPLPAAWQALDLAPLRTAWGLDGLEARPARAAAGLDPHLYAACMEELAMARDEAAIGQAALEGAMALVGAARGYVLSYEEGRLRQVVTVGASFAEVEGGFSNSIAEEVLFSSRPVYVSDASNDPTWKASASVVALQLRTVVCLPLAVPDRILGVLYLDREELEPLLGPGDVALLGALAVAAAALIVRERDRRAEAEAAGLARLCADLGRTLANAEADRVRAAMLAAAVAATGADRGFWLDPAGQALAATAPYDPASVSRGILDWVATSRQPLGLMDASNTEAWQSRGSVQALGLRTVWCVPAGADGVVYLDAARMIEADPGDGLRAVEALVGFAEGLV